MNFLVEIDESEFKNGGKEKKKVEKKKRVMKSFCCWTACIMSLNSAGCMNECSSNTPAERMTKTAPSPTFPEPLILLCFQDRDPTVNVGQKRGFILCCVLLRIFPYRPIVGRGRDILLVLLDPFPAWGPLAAMQLNIFTKLVHANENDEKPSPLNTKLQVSSVAYIPYIYS